MDFTGAGTLTQRHPNAQMLHLSEPEKRVYCSNNSFIFHFHAFDALPDATTASLPKPGQPGQLGYSESGGGRAHGSTWLAADCARRLKAHLGWGTSPNSSASLSPDHIRHEPNTHDNDDLSCDQSSRMSTLSVRTAALVLVTTGAYPRARGPSRTKSNALNRRS